MCNKSTSTQKAEDLNLNRIETGTLTYSDLKNISEYDASGISIGGGFGINGKGEQSIGGIPLSAQGQTDASGMAKGEGLDGATANKLIGFGLDSDKAQSVTKSGINTQNITIADEQKQQDLTGKTAEQMKSDILTDITTDIARENSGALQNVFDKDQVQSEINVQMDVTQAFDANRQEGRLITSIANRSSQANRNLLQPCL